MYAAQAGAAGGGDGHAGSSSTAGAASGAAHADGKDNVVDAEFEEVKDPGKS
jgi:hypothetical protein